MTFSISPSVDVTEKDFSLTVVSSANYIGSTAGFAQWGPVDQPTLITGGEADFVGRFFKPNNTTALDQITAIDFLRYSPKMWYTRVTGLLAANAVSNGTAVAIRNSDAYEEVNMNLVKFVARYPGSLGNQLTVSVVDAVGFENWEFRGNYDYAPRANEFAVAVVDGSSNFSGLLGRSKQIERLTVDGLPDVPATAEVRRITMTGTALVANTSITIMGLIIPLLNGDTTVTAADKVAAALISIPGRFTDVTSALGVVNFTYVQKGVVADSTANVVGLTLTAATSVITAGTGGTSTISFFGVNVIFNFGDTRAVAVGKIVSALIADVTFSTAYEGIVSEGNSILYTSRTYGKLTPRTPPTNGIGLTYVNSVVSPGRLGTLLERFEIVTNTPGDKNADGTSRYFIDAINKGSKYIYVGDRTIPLATGISVLAGGVDDYNTTRITALNAYSNAEKLDINYIWVAGSLAEQQTVCDVVDTRKDCMAFISPQMGDVVNRPGQELANVIQWRSVGVNRDSSYVVNTDNWASVYDAYNDVNRWIPTCAGTAGLVARTSADFDPWISPAGHQRGRFKNYLKTAWSASRPQRDEMYKIGVNSVVNFPAEGILLYGDKTSTSRPSAFSRYNVRAAFIIAEKSVANMAKQFLFELNNSLTRSQFVNSVRPFLRNMQGRQAFEDFRVICDEKNNDAEVRAGNQMVGSIMIKPLYSINFVKLNFAVVRPDVSFEEVENFI